MKSLTKIDNIIRLRLKSIRQARSLRMQDVASRAGIPLSSYSSIENGYHCVKPGKLHRILNALDADINDVWPAMNVRDALGQRPSSQLRTLESHAHDLVSIFRAESAGLFVIQQGRCWPLLTSNIDPETACRLAFYIETHVESDEGELFFLEVGKLTFCLLVDGRKSSVPTGIVDYFLDKWATAFSKDSRLLDSAKDRYPQP